MRARRVLLSVAGVAAVATAVILSQSLRDDPAARVAEAKTALEQHEYLRALELTSPLLNEKQPSVDAFLVGIRAARLSGQPEVMFEYGRRLPETTDSPEVVDALKECGQAAIRSGHATDAEGFYERALVYAPDDLVIHRRLSALYLSECRRWESTPHLLALIKGKAFTLDNLAFLGNSEELYDAEQMIAYFERSVPDDLAPLMGRARLLIFKGFSEEGEALLRQILARHPELVEAQAQLGVVLVSKNRGAEFREWQRQLPVAADEHPEVWWARATQSQREGNRTGAIRCAWEALRLDPNHQGATYQLAQLLASDGQPKAAQEFAERAGQLEELASAIHHILLREATATHMLRCASLCESIGRLWEAWAWHVAIETYHPDKVVEGERDRLAALLTPETPQMLPTHQLALKYDFSNYPLPRWHSLSEGDSVAPQYGEFQIRFEEVAANAGLDFRYENGVATGQRGLMIYQSIGSGVAVVDYDRDGSPDLFFPQASAESPLATWSSDASDRMFRNVRGQAIDVTRPALAEDRGFGFGVNTGDFDCDGFPDLYVANARLNCLLRNNGDGTFTDVTDSAGLTDVQWTVSTLVADINSDGLPDLYDVNYCGGERPFSHVCLRKNGEPRTCIPTEFSAADDRLLVNCGDGRFREASETAGILEPEGRGLGIIAARFDDQPGLDLYVANDMTANFLFLNRTSVPGGPPLFQSRGVMSGTAYDSNGRPQASMGIAADDATGDGLLDLFLTHFYNESNTFYCQHAGGVFVDETNLVDLRTPGMQLLGFGTQFIDAELDGWPDLVVVNGHVDDFSEQEIPNRMRAQFFHNDGGRFVEASAEDVGGFFALERLGRGLARLDWNRDGLDDFVAAYLVDPAALLLNRSSNSGHSVRIRLTGRLDRDAIGTEVSLTSGGRTLVKQLVAGDGFASSNERWLVFGLGHSSRVDEIRVRWPSGGEDVFFDPPLDRELHVVEGRPAPFLLPWEGL